MAETTFTFRVEEDLKAAFSAAAKADDRSSAQLLRGFMRDYVRQKDRGAFVREARRQSGIVSARAQAPDSDDAQVQRWIDDVADYDGWTS